MRERERERERERATGFLRGFEDIGFTPSSASTHLPFPQVARGQCFDHILQPRLGGIAAMKVAAIIQRA